MVDLFVCEPGAALLDKLVCGDANAKPHNHRTRHGPADLVANSTTLGGVVHVQHLYVRAQPSAVEHREGEVCRRRVACGTNTKLRYQHQNEIEVPGSSGQFRWRSKEYCGVTVTI